MEYSGFDQVNELDTKAQHQLLEEGTPLEKLWAAWSLGLKLDRTLQSHLVSKIHQTPVPGLRAKFIIILAGMGERGVLEVLANHDSDEIVRETACYYLLKIASHDEKLQKLLIGRLFKDESKRVRKFVLEQAIANFPILNRNHIEDLLSDEDVEIKLIAFSLAAPYDYAWILNGLPVDTGIELVEKVFFDWVLWTTGYKENPTRESREEGLGITYAFSERLATIPENLQGSEIVIRAKWVYSKLPIDQRQINLHERSDALFTKMCGLDKNVALDFLTELFVGWASRQENSSEIILNLGRIMYYAT